MPIMVRLPDDLRDRIDAARSATISREAWVRSACERALNGAAPPPTSVPTGNSSSGAAAPEQRPVPPRASAVRGAGAALNAAGGEMCAFCRDNGPPRTRPCAKCGHQARQAAKR